MQNCIDLTNFLSKLVFVLMNKLAIRFLYYHVQMTPTKYICSFSSRFRPIYPKYFDIDALLHV